MTVEFKDVQLKRLNGPAAKAAINAVSAKTGNTATPIDRVKAAEGFQVELLYSVPAEVHGSRVNMCEDNKGACWSVISLENSIGSLRRLPARL